MRNNTVNKFLLTLSMLVCSFTQTSYADIRLCDGTVENPCIVQDTKPDSYDLLNWRTAQMIRDTYHGNTTGLKNLWVSVSGAPGKKGFDAIKEQIAKTTKTKYSKIIDIDLREESHAFLNGNAITLMSESNWINRGKTHQQSVADEEQWVNSLNGKGEIPHILSEKQYRSKKFDQGDTIKVTEVQLEKDLVESKGINYLRLTVSDHLHPDSTEVNSFVNLVNQVDDKTWLHIHCRGGKGRSTTFFAMIDMLRNANKVSFMDIIKRQAAVAPFYDLSDINRKAGDNAKEYQERYNFLQHFYSFATDKLNGYAYPWTQWLEEHGLTD